MKKLLLLLLLVSVSLQQDNSLDTDQKQKAKKLKKEKKLKKLVKVTSAEVTTLSSSTVLEGDEADERGGGRADLPGEADERGGGRADLPGEPGERGGGRADLPVRTRLRRQLLRRYDKNVHPVHKHSDRVKVDVGMALIHLSLDELTSVLEVNSWLRLTWTDQFLAWNVSDFQGVEQIHFGSEEIWRPDIQLYNSADSGQTQHFGHTHFIVYSTGEVLWVPPAKFRAFCKIDLKLWPLETQKCKLKFGSWTSHGDQIDLGLYHNLSSVERLNFYTNNKEWEVLTTLATRSVAKYDCCPEEYPDVTFQFFLQRRSPFFRCAIILPCLVTMLLVVASFLLPPSAGEKIIVNSTCLIVCILYLIYFATTLPALSDQIPLIVLFYSNTAALIGIAIVLNICCLTITRDRRYSSPPKLVRDLFSGVVGRLLCLGHYYHQVSNTHHRLMVEMDSVSESPESEQDPPEMSEGRKQQEWMLVAAGIERFFFIIYTIAFAVVSSAYI